MAAPASRVAVPKAPVETKTVLPPARVFAERVRTKGPRLKRLSGPPARNVTLTDPRETKRVEAAVVSSAAKRNLTLSKNRATGAVIQFAQPEDTTSVAPPVITLHRPAGKPPGNPVLRKIESTTVTSSGNPLPVAIRNPLSQSFSIDLTPIRVHMDARAQHTARSFNTRAFAYGHHIFLGPGESPNDLRLMAHEVAHVVQQSGGAVLQHFTPARGDVYEQEAEQAASAVMRGDSFKVEQRTTPRPQGILGIDLGIPDPLEWLAGKANAIPGFRMLTIVLGVNPITMNRVERSAANILRALVEFMPGGFLIVEALDNHGVFDKAGAFVERQLDNLGLVGASIGSAVSEFISGLDLPGDLLRPGTTWERAKRIFTEPIDRIRSFAAGLVGAIIEIIKDAILRPIARLAEGTAGYNLLKGVLGYDPITDEPVTRSAETLLGPLLNMIGLGDVWQKMQQARAIPRAWAWFQSTISTLVGFVSQIPSLFLAAFQALTIEDIILVPRAFAKLAAVFGGFMSSFVSWGVGAMFKLLEIVFDVVSPGAFGYVKRTGAALQSILQNPLPFVGNLGRAAKLGFQNFAGNFVSHLRAGLLEWLTGSLTGVYIPRSFALGEIVKFIFSVLGLTWANVRQKLVRATNETVVRAMEAGFDIVRLLVTQGPAAAWDKIKEHLTNLKDMVIQGIIDLVVDAVVTKAVPKLVAMFIPGAGFISAIISIYDMIMVFVNRISRIIQVVTAFINSITAIAAGNIGAAAGRVESILAGLLSLAINFLAGFAGLGRIAGRVMGVINRIRAPIDRALDALVGWIVGMARRLGRFLVQAGVPEDPNRRLQLAARAAVAAARRLSGPITGGLLQPVLSIVQARYGLTSIVPMQRGGTWWVRMTINPILDYNLGLSTVASPTPAPAPSTLQPMPLIGPISFRCNTLKYDPAVYDQQLQGQASGLNAISVTEWAQNRDNYRNQGRGTGAAQEAARNQLRADLASQGKTPAEIDATMERLAALHEPDLVAGGRDWITRLGSRYINSSIGAQWRTNVSQIETAVSVIPIADKPRFRINVSLRTAAYSP
jgi:hypothetical protein